MAATNPYAADLGQREPVSVLADTHAHLTKLFEGWAPADFERTYAPGKWPARQMMLHMLHIELTFGWRLRMALTTDHYQLQPMEQDDWMHAEALVPAIEAWNGWRALRAVNLRLVRHLKTDQLARPFAHPDYGEWTIATLVQWLAGHDCHHLPQFDRLTSASVPTRP